MIRPKTVVNRYLLFGLMNRKAFISTLADEFHRSNWRLQAQIILSMSALSFLHAHIRITDPKRFCLLEPPNACIPSAPAVLGGA